MINAIHNQDCIKLMEKMISKSIVVDFIFADLPYGVTSFDWDKKIDIEAFWSLVPKILKNNGCVALTATQPYSSELVMSNPEWFRYQWIWEKTNGSGHLNAKRRPLSCHEQVLIFYKNSPIYNPQITYGHPRKQTKRKANSGSGFYEDQTIETVYDSDQRYPRDVLLIPMDTQTSSLHPTQKPVALSSYMISTYTNANALVLDVTAGSGGTGVSCLQLNRDFILCDKEAKFCHIAQDRLANVVRDISV